MRERAAGRLPVAAAACVLIAGLASLGWTGVRTGGDTPGYLADAARLIAGRAMLSTMWASPGYVALLAFCQLVHVGLTGVILIQLLAAAAALLIVARLGAALAGSTAGAIAAIVLACDINTMRWHTFILSDSLYMSTLVVAVWLVHRASETAGGDWRRFLPAAAALAALAALRPEGWLVLAASVVYASRRRSLVPAIAVAGACASVMVVAAPQRFRDAVGLLLVNGRTLWGYDGWRLTMPAATTAEGGLTTVMGYALAHPVAVAALLLARVAVLLVNVRPFYSPAHNVAIVIWLVPVYAFALRGWFLVRDRPLARWMAVVIAAHVVLVALTHADWDGRFLAHVIPLICAFAGVGVQAWTRSAPRPPFASTLVA